MSDWGVLYGDVLLPFGLDAGDYFTLLSMSPSGVQAQGAPGAPTPYVIDELGRLIDPNDSTRRTSVSIWTDLASNLGGALVGALGEAATNRIQTILRGDNPVQAFDPFLSPIGTDFGGGGFTSGLPMELGGGVSGRRRRRMNPTNVHALRRSLRRVEGFVKLEKRVDKIVNRLSRSSRSARAHGFIRKKRR